MRAIRIYIVEDHARMRRLLRRFIEAEADMEVIGQAGSAEEALPDILAAAPDVLLVDLSLPGMRGDRFVAELLRRGKTNALVVSGHEARTYASLAQRAGARGYVMKDDPDEIVRAIRAVAAGGTHGFRAGGASSGDGRRES